MNPVIKLFVYEAVKEDIDPDKLTRQIIERLETPSEFKTTGRKKAYVLQHRGAKLFLKSFNLNDPISKIRCSRYARQEYVNHVRAWELGVPTSRPVAWYVVKKFGFPISTGIVSEFLEGSRSVEEMLQRGQSANVINSCASALVACAVNGVNHIDMNPNNIFLQEDGLKPRIIDWQHCSYFPHAPIKILMMSTHYLIRHLSGTLSAHAISELLSDITNQFPFKLTEQEASQFIEFALREKRYGYRSRLKLNF